MGFSETYLERCWHARRLWSRKRTTPGDWYLGGHPLQLHIVGDADPQGVHFAAEDLAFVPDADDLLELLDNQVAAHGTDPAQKALAISYNPDDQWRIEIACGDRTTVAGGHESMHAALTVAFFPGDWRKGALPLRYLALRIRKTQGHLFASGADTKYLAIVSNRWALAPSALLRWHWQKAGTIELVHAITKNELGAAVPPCPPAADFGSNAAWYRLSLLTYNLLSALNSLAVPPARSGSASRSSRWPVGWSRTRGNWCSG